MSPRHHEPKFYALVGRDTRLCADIMEYATAMVGVDTRVALDEIPVAGGEPVRISTVFLGYNHSLYSLTPHIFETMVFQGTARRVADRYSTWDEAVAGHAAVLAEERARL
jgi:hypothetical protein